jgi:membrane protein required for colicin V production
MPSYLDLGLIAIVLISALLSMTRGFTREVLAIASWVAAAAAAYYFYPSALPYAKQYIQKDQIALGVSVVAIFFVTLIVVSLITVKLSDAILDSKIGALDRTLGFLFGVGRGLLIGVVAFMFFNWLVPPDKQPEWAKNARTRPFLAQTGQQLLAMLPADPENELLKRFRNPPQAGSDQGDPEADPKADPKAAPAPPAPAPDPQKKTDASPVIRSIPMMPAAASAPIPAPTPAIFRRN